MDRENPPDTTKQSVTRGVVAVVAIAALLVAALVVLELNRPDPEPLVPSLTGPAPSAGEQALADELAELGDLFGQVLENDRDAGPLLERIDALLAEQPGSVAAHTLRGQVLLYAGEPERAVKAFERSLEIEPRQADIHRLAGTAQMKLGRLEAAQSHYERALAVEPDDGTHAVYLANAQHKLGRDHEAIATLLAAIRRDSTLHGAYALLSDIYAQQNKLELALGQIRRAIDHAPAERASTLTVYTLKRAALLRQDNQPAESLAVLNSLPAESQVRPDVLRDTAASWAMLGKPAMAAQRYERVLVVDPASDHAAAEAARWWLKAGDTDGAARNLKALRRINPRHPAIPELAEALDGA